MGNLSFFDYVFNVCRSFSDVLHICAYLLLVVIALIAALYKFDINLYNKHIYIPLLKVLYKRGYINVECYVSRGRRFSKQLPVIRWTVNSNRLPYFVRVIKNFFKKF